MAAKMSVFKKNVHLREAHTHNYTTGPPMKMYKRHIDGRVERQTDGHCDFQQTHRMER